MEGKGKVGRRRIEEDTEGNCRGNALRRERERERERQDRMSVVKERERVRMG